MKRRKTPAGRPESARPKDSPAAEPEPDGPGSEGLRLNKFLAQRGVASRRGADELIAGGQVTVDGRIVTELGTRIDPERQKVEVGGVVLQAGGERPRYYLLNKPKGVVCTNDPREGRQRAIDLISDRKKGRIYTVGRLDEDTEGLVLLTNDGEFANRVSHPRYGVRKTYWVDVRARVDEETLRRMHTGVRLAEGWSRFERVRVVKRSEERSILHVTLGEGKNREVRRVLANLGLPVRSLRRISIGPLQDRRLKLGQWRPLVRAEVEELLSAAGAEVERGSGRHPEVRRQGPALSPRRRRTLQRSRGERWNGDRRRRPRRARPGRGARASD